MEFCRAILGFLVRRAFARVAEMLFYVEIVDALAVTGLRDLVWNDGHLVEFLAIGFGVSFLIDLVVEVTRPSFPLIENVCDDDGS